MYAILDTIPHCLLKLEKQTTYKEHYLNFQLRMAIFILVFGMIIPIETNMTFRKEQPQLSQVDYL